MTSVQISIAESLASEDVNVSATKKRTRARAPCSFWTTREDAYLREAYSDTPMPEMVNTLRRQATAIQKHAQVLNLKRSATYLASEYAGRIRPGERRSQATEFRARSASIDLAQAVATTNA